MPKAKQIEASPPTTGLRIGYARKSKEDQDLALQRDALTRAGCIEIYEEQVSRAGPLRDKKGATELANALRSLRPGDTLVVWRLDRLGGSVSELIRIVTHQLKERGIGFESLTEKIDTSTAAGNMFFQIAAVFAEYERRQLIERTKAGLEAARARGRKGGRKKSLTPKQVREAKALLADPNITVADVCAHFGIGRTTLYSYVGSVQPLRKQTDENPA
ncbi:recombinase family protein [Xanthomonas campestris pv. campestris]|nr:recombinase family protein [Xanthomonas campestris pv. campestris]MEB1789646.1 recombinase family protein [Xanthomonas campestris pv. campestris]MEB1844528.1 recombinase family protein [Xanthomonas campestris pv. campestris]MEB1878288.1 recombinase family protein [Xanthomonas campestris pv. campestris]